MHIKNAFLGGDVKKWYEKNLRLAIFQAKTARKDGRGGLENGDMIFFSFRIIFFTLKEVSVKWAKNQLDEVPPTNLRPNHLWAMLSGKAS